MKVQTLLLLFSSCTCTFVKYGHGQEEDKGHHHDNGHGDHEHEHGEEEQDYSGEDYEEKWYETVWFYVLIRFVIAVVFFFFFWLLSRCIYSRLTSRARQDQQQQMLNISQRYAQSRQQHQAEPRDDGSSHPYGWSYDGGILGGSRDGVQEPPSYDEISKPPLYSSLEKKDQLNFWCRIQIFSYDQLCPSIGQLVRRFC